MLDIFSSEDHFYYKILKIVLFLIEHLFWFTDNNNVSIKYTCFILFLSEQFMGFACTI